VSASVTWTGLEELQAALRALPAALAGDGADIIENRAEVAKASIIQGYPLEEGDLRNKVEVEHTRSEFGARSVVRSTSTHAEEFEYGTEARHYTTKRGVRHLTGKMPPGHVFVPAVVRERHRMYDELKDLLVSHGLTVSGDA